MSDPRKILEKGVRAGIQSGAQLYLSQKGKVLLDFACGEGRPGIPMRTDSIVPWLSTGKPLTALLVARLFERGAADLEAPVSSYIPEFRQHGKASITIRHLLTHTAGIRRADKIPERLPWGKTIETICATPLEDGWVPGERAGYSTGASWFILAEVIQRLSGVRFDLYIKRELLDPLGMEDTWLALPPEQIEVYGDRIAEPRDNSAPPEETTSAQNAEEMARCRPGSSARGPIREIGRFYEMLLNGGRIGEEHWVKPETVSLFTSRQRTGMFDETFVHKLDFGFGFILNSTRYGPETVPYGYGRHCSEETFGHSGARSSCAFADPVHKLAVAWVTTALTGERLHQKRQREVNDAIYEYLGLAK